MKYKLGIIGVGVMGQAFLKCITKKNIIASDKIALFDVCKDKVSIYENTHAICNNIQDLINSCEYILIAIKPQQFDLLSQSVNFSQKNTVISIMAGLKITTIKEKIGKIGLARVMPNTPCQIGKGICAVCYSDVNIDNQIFINKILSSCGKVIEIEECLFDAVTSVSGSGPAYVYMFIEGMIRGGMNGGLSYNQSKELVLKTIIGTAYLANKSKDTPDILCEKVCSKGGTTIEAVKIYNDKNLISVIQEGMNACRKRSEEISNSL